MFVRIVILTTFFLCSVKLMMEVCTAKGFLSWDGALLIVCVENVYGCRASLVKVCELDALDQRGRYGAK